MTSATTPSNDTDNRKRTRHLSVQTMMYGCHFVYASVWQRPSMEMPDSGVIFCKTDYVLGCLAEMNKRPGPFVLVTTQSDYTIHDVFFKHLPQQCVRWFAANCESHHVRAEGIPLGLTSDDLLHGNFNIVAVERTVKRPIRNLCHLRLAPTHPERHLVQTLFEKESWVLGGIYSEGQYPLTFDGYLQEMHSCPFTMAPRGNGIDTHRIWEALYLGVTPIVKRHPAMDWFEGFPILFVDDWRDVTREYLEHELTKRNRPWNANMLWAPYWWTQFQAEYHGAL